MSLRMSEEEYTAFLRRRGLKQCAAPPSSGVSVKDMEPEKGRIITSQLLPAEPPPPKRNKYGNRRVEIDGMKFDSQYEADYYFGVLVPRLKAGELRNVLRQVKFELPGGIVYVADFVTILPDMRIESIIDAKSEATKNDKVYIIKKKQMKACLGIEIQEV